MKQFSNLTQLFDFFKDEDTCRNYLEQKRWGGNVACPHCGSLKVYRTKRGFVCGEKECLKKFTVKVGTVYESSKIPLRTWFAAIYLATSSKKGVSSYQIARQLGVTQKTAWFLNHRIREMLKEKAPHMLKEQVQVDETYVGGKEINKHASKRTRGAYGRSTDTKTPVFGICETGGKVVVRVSNWINKKTAKNFINSHVDAGSTMVTDGYSVYAFLGADDKFHHVMVDHKKGQYVKAGFHTNGIENFWSLLKRGIIGVYHQVSPWHLQRYCDEFAARYNTRKITDDERFDLVLLGSEGRLKYNQLIGRA